MNGDRDAPVLARRDLRSRYESALTIDMDFPHSRLTGIVVSPLQTKSDLVQMFVNRTRLKPRQPPSTFVYHQELEIRNKLHACYEKLGLA